jgi:RNA polymerase sigma factor (sigma-70 family)
MQELTDTELLRQYADQDSEAAFAALVTRHVNLVYSAAFRKTGNPHAAEEITQAVFIILARKARALRRETVLPGWLYQATRLTAANFLRNEIRRVRREQESYMQSLANETEVWPQIEPLLEDAMGRLSEKERNAIVLRFFEGKSFQEIGAAAGGSENAAKKRVGHGLEKLRKFFAQHGVSSTTAVIAGVISANSIQAAPAAMAKSITAVAVAKGAAASGSTLTLMKGALKIMAWTKAKMAVVSGVGLALLLAGGAITVGLAEKGASDKSTPAEILHKVQASYDALTTYSDSGKGVSETSGETTTTAFAVKFARPDLYLIQQTQSRAGRPTVTGAIWPADGQIFMLANQGNRTRYFRLSGSGNGDPLEISAGFSAASGLSAAGLFFHKKPLESHWQGAIEKLAASTNVVRLPDERVAGTSCYVLKMSVPGYGVVLWIGQRDFLIHKRHVVLMAQADPHDTFDVTETHTEILVNPVFSKADMTPRIPDGVKLEMEPIH